MPITRFAPSPTGRLHLGHAWSAIQAHDFARTAGGRFLLRIEDIDGSRSRAEHVAGIIEDLRWLGLDWDEPPWFQSQRLEVYAAALERLRAAGLLYPCFCTRADIAREIAASPIAPHGPTETVYPGICRGKPVDPERLAREPHCWRLDMAKALRTLPAPLFWQDAFAGTVLADPATAGDVVLARKDAPASYHLAVTLDDAAQGITDVIRGVDLFAATHVHRLLQDLLDLPTPRYHHHPLLADAEGNRLAKRHNAPTLVGLQAQGIDGRKLADSLRAGQLPVGFALTKA